MIAKHSPALFDPKATLVQKAEARRQIERATIRAAVHSAVGTRINQVWSTKRAKENALAAEERERRITEAIKIFEAEHAAAGRDQYYFSHLWDVGERFGVGHHAIMDHLLPKPMPYTDQARDDYSAALKTRMVWDSHNEPDCESPVFAPVERKKPLRSLLAALSINFD